MLQALFTKEMIEILLSAIIVAGLLAVLAFLIKRALSPNNSYKSIDLIVKKFVYLVSIQKSKHSWGFFSSDLQNQLTKMCEETLNQTQVPISHYLERFFKQNQTAFLQGKPVIISRHKVAQSDEGVEMVMVHVKSHQTARKITLWLSRHLASQGSWRIEDLFIHPGSSSSNYKVQTVSTMCLSGRKLTLEQKNQLLNNPHQSVKTKSSSQSRPQLTPAPIH